jgi:hypothetical protein
MMPIVPLTPFSKFQLKITTILTNNNTNNTIHLLLHPPQVSPLTFPSPQVNIAPTMSLYLKPSPLNHTYTPTIKLTQSTTLPLQHIISIQIYQP